VRDDAGFSQERTTWVALTVKDANGFLVYQSGYQVDKPHPDTGEMQPDGNIDDEDLEHLRAVVDPGRKVDKYAPGAANNGHGNQVFDVGPDDGPDARVYVGAAEGLVLFRNELTRIFLPGQPLGRNDANGNPIIVTRPHYEETFSAAFANTVDNYRSLQPLEPRIFRYQIKMPTADELKELGVELKGPLQVHAEVHYEHFPPVFMRFIARTTGPDGPSGTNLGLMNEKVIDDLLKTNRTIAVADFTVAVEK